MWWDQVMTLFSRRTKIKPRPTPTLSRQCRYRIVNLCQDIASGARDDFPQDRSRELWNEVYKGLCFLHGGSQLSEGPPGTLEDLNSFLGTCSDEHFLDFIELVFRSETVFSKEKLRDAIDDLFRYEALPYALTDFAYEDTTVWLYGHPHKGTKTTAYPQVIPRESNLLHQTAIEPTLSFLTRPDFAQANAEFLEAHSHYRKGEYGDCLIKCGSAFESVMKVICHLKGWEYHQDDGASRLLETIFANASLESFFRQPLTLVATMRNHLSKAHGAGTKPRSVPKHVASYAVTSCAASILLLVYECGLGS